MNDRHSANAQPDAHPMVPCRCGGTRSWPEQAGLAGVGLFHVVVFAFLFGARESTGYVLPLLVPATSVR